MILQKKKKCCNPPSKSNLMSLAAWMPSSFRFFSIILLRARAARSSADMAQPILLHVALTNATPAALCRTSEYEVRRLSAILAASRAHNNCNAVTSTRTTPHHRFRSQRIRQHKHLRLRRPLPTFPRVTREQRAKARSR